MVGRALPTESMHVVAKEQERFVNLSDPGVEHMVSMKLSDGVLPFLEHSASPSGSLLVLQSFVFNFELRVSWEASQLPAWVVVSSEV